MNQLSRFSLMVFVFICSVSIANATVSDFMSESKEYGKIVGLTTASAIAYGVVQDQITARVCLEYFTKGFHERMMHEWNTPFLVGVRELLIKHKDSPTIVAGIWGVLATWWVGLPLGVLLALSARAGNLPKIKAEELKGKVFKSLAITGAASAVSGLVGYILTKNGMIEFGTGARGVPHSKMSAFGADAFAHTVAYNVGALTGIGMCLALLKERYDLSWEQTIKEREGRLSQLYIS